MRGITKNSTSKRLFAMLLSIVMLLSVFPVGAYMSAWAAPVETFTVTLPNELEATVTLENESDASDSHTEPTYKGVATFTDVLDDEATYKVTITEMEDYCDYSKTGVSPTADLTIEKIELTEKAENSISFSETEVSKKYGNPNFSVSLNEIGLGTGETTYTSSTVSVATVDNSGVVTITGVGTTVITVNKASDDTYKSAHDAFTLKVEKADGALVLTTEEVNWVVDDVQTNAPSLKENASGKITYSINDSSASDVVKLNGETGEVTVLRPGTAVIDIHFEADEASFYGNDDAFYTIIAIKKANALFYENTAINVTYGDSNGTNDSLRPSGLDGDITYSSSNEGVAKVDPATGEYTIVGAGETTITAHLTGDSRYEDTDATYQLRVAKKSDVLSFASVSQDYTYGDAVKENKLTAPSDIEGSVKFTSSDDTIVSVDPATGAITILKAGLVTITATLEEETNYNTATASYTVNIQKKNIEFEISIEKEYGQPDPDDGVREIIKSQIKSQLVDSEKDNADVVTRILACVTTEYEGTSSGEERELGSYAINFDFTDDDCYFFSAKSSTLTVNNNYIAQEGTDYTIEGLNNDNWGSVKGTVVIKATGNRLISKDNKANGNWDTKLVYDTEEEITAHSFYIRDLDNNNRISNEVKKDFGVDGTDPTITQFEYNTKNNSTLSRVLNFLTFGIFFNEEIDVTVTADDANPSNPSSGVASIELFFNDEYYGVSSDLTGNTATFTLTVDKFATLKTIAARATDKVGNTPDSITYANSLNTDGYVDKVQLEQIPAEITVDFPSATSLNGSEKWYGDDIEITAKVTDADDTNSGIRSVWAVINGVNVDITFKGVQPYSDENITSSNAAYYFINEKTEEVNFTINTNLVDIPAKPDGKYSIEIFAIDNAGTVVKYDASTEAATVDVDSAKPIEVYIDRDIPSITGFEFKATNGVEGNQLPVVTNETYGYFFQQDTDVVVTAKDARPSAGIYQIEFYTIDEDGKKTDYSSAESFVDTSNNDTVIVSATFTIPKGFKGQIYARAIDRVSHTTLNTDGTPEFFNPNGTAIEDSQMHKEHSEATVTLVDSTSYKDNNGLPLFNENAQVKMYVKDTFSGISSITWAVVAPYNATENDSNGTTTVGIYLDETVKVGDVIDGWTVEAVDKNLVTEMSRIIEVSNNCNDISVELSFKDRALNKSTANTLHFSIDKTAPTIDIKYDNNTPDSTYNTIYKDNRTATITITERNFKAEDVIYKITNTDGVIPKLSAWTEHKNTVDPDETYYTATITYVADGDYTFDISYIDLASNAANAVAQHQFTIDKTIPKVTVTYDNNSALNGIYYKEARTATITIVEHNFDAARVKVIGVATDNGAATTFPTTSAWTNNGDTHTATITYSADARYSFDIEFLDKAGNSIENYTPEEFFVDKTAPTLEITGVADKSANKGTVAPIIRFFDTNFDRNNVTITLSGIHNGVVNYSGSYADIENGQIFTYADFEKIQTVDDIYTLTATLTDMAGNETSETISFSANRFGSVYDLKAVENILNKYLSVEQDIVFTETNVDSLDREGILIKLTKNGTPTDLVEGTDYTVEVSGGNGQWSVYTYTIKKALFTDDGRYSISIYSTDAAGNVNENIDESKSAEISFGIDKTNPVIVPIDLESGTPNRPKEYVVELKNVEVEIKDNLVLEEVKIFLNDEEVEYTVDGETYTFAIPKSNNTQDVKVVATDAAGNEAEVKVENFLVSTNIWARWRNNTPLFVGSIIGVVVITIGIIAFVLFGKKKKKKEEK